MFLQAIKMTDEVTVSSLPHPISMFLLGIFAVTIIFVLIEVNRFKREIELNKEFLQSFATDFEKMKNESESKFSEISKKVDSRVDKAISSLKRNNVLNN